MINNFFPEGKLFALSSAFPGIQKYELVKKVSEQIFQIPRLSLHLETLYSKNLFHLFLKIN